MSTFVRCARGRECLAKKNESQGKRGSGRHEMALGRSQGRDSIPGACSPSEQTPASGVAPWVFPPLSEGAYVGGFMKGLN